ncbi:serine hydrolase [Sphingorhabdus sp. SMR4y]|uniref:serine hydrolase n=1 Tax=Sphingorhabdus sp. SMR4y TaxID=2584094 RepID=UPI000B5CC455|nr:serine hydrolase [Sphingorhabdus sp. SMR4y]ASK87942.1 beta-lactamase enzyme family protein [Sphingorhabdus sp. SMR4y]
MMVRYLFVFALCLFSASQAFPSNPANAQTQTPQSPQLSSRAHDVLRLLRGETIEAEVFDENFRNAVPPARFRDLVRQVTEQRGPPLAISSIDARNGNAAILKIRYARSIATVNIDLETDAPHRISGLQLTGFEAIGDTIGEVLAAIDALPGRQGILIQPLDEPGLPPTAALDPDGRYAIASTVKLYILAELDRSIQAGERQWSDVVQLGPKSHPSGISQNWPDRSPVTLHTLATLMISISDNSATDSLIRIIGQDGLANIVRASGHHNPDELQPLLMTRQASTLKMPVHAERREQYLNGSPAEREQLLAEFDSALTLDSLDSRILTHKPLFIDQLEWFASPADVVRLLDYLRLNASNEARQILAINPGIGKAAAEKWEYFGYKGGSEPGVLSLNFLLRSKTGGNYAVSVNWNDKELSLQESDLLSLTTRMVNLLAEQ